MPRPQGFGEAATTYRLRDWGVSRQRFWGSPIPIIYCDSCGVVPEKYENLPVELPDTAPFTGTGRVAIGKSPGVLRDDLPELRRRGAARNRYDGYFCGFVLVLSSATWTRKIPALPFSPEIAAYWAPVDQYVGGDDHAVMHLIYTRFWAKVMRDIGLVTFDEPIKRLLTQGMVVGETFFDDETGKRIYHPAGGRYRGA